MKTKILIATVFFLTITACSKDEEDCKCNQYLKSANGSLTLYGEASMEFCNRTVANPSPQMTTYNKECK